MIELPMMTFAAEHDDSSLFSIVSTRNGHRVFRCSQSKGFSCENIVGDGENHTTRVAYCPTNKTYALGTQIEPLRGEIRIFDARNQETRRLAFRGRLGDLLFSEDGRTLASVLYKGERDYSFGGKAPAGAEIQTHELQTGTVSRFLHEDPDKIYDLCFIDASTIGFIATNLEGTGDAVYALNLKSKRVRRLSCPVKVFGLRGNGLFTQALVNKPGSSPFEYGFSTATVGNDRLDVSADFASVDCCWSSSIGPDGSMVVATDVRRGGGVSEIRLIKPHGSVSILSDLYDSLVR